MTDAPAAKEEPMKKVLPIVIVMLLIIGVGGGVAWSLLAGRYKPTEEVLDYASVKSPVNKSLYLKF